MSASNAAPDAAAEAAGAPATALLVDPVAAAHRLLGATIFGRGVSGVIVEVEAYGGVPDGPWPDAAAHSYRGRNTRNAVMFGPPGRLYTYRSHGIHVCANVACGPDGTAAAVLLRACAIDDGFEAASARRGPAIRPVALARGPGNLCSALGITMDDNGIDLFDPNSPVTVTLSEANGVVSGPRVGVSKAADRPWRLWLAGRPEVSAYRRSPRAPTPGRSD
ncbi:MULTISPECIES: DNA-3-methyladenine glycosylase [Mycobacterium]|uniref:Putative 3-methyladenine DNA glycosylase n=1 Tax=Mycobacterium kiyosense TaxID=2871094 RepID=A0A9P3PZP0_9MYCO|nr:MULTISPECIES: DNA-3-methyladenine glycosylase [Mycobacterium]BDB42771.1 putative 3-methyladenine DNA glycosylase [Mycobacterium kiyosense]BDE13979.1 putative 3-methyladenine DNA glycosylase [Mycobacterium sp. 20KCMC460]GLB81265.1 putative 3-methyladenine DNA glycosylase [Mycobacterium kiyosense]GLB88297.1 putative 3-methyladenine DNA glycosylase [Mycobacterium kiyosense]GLB94601.1 putative 3-methyladenine DNA glycosylase [Mycobacterium kiyosense]